MTRDLEISIVRLNGRTTSFEDSARADGLPSPLPSARFDATFLLEKVEQMTIDQLREMIREARRPAEVGRTRKL